MANHGGLAAVAWIKHHPALAIDHALDDMDSRLLLCEPSSRTRVRQFCRRAGITSEELDALATEAKRRGVADQYKQRTVDVAPDRSVPVFHPISRDWLQIDGTVPIVDARTRHRRMPRWNENSCAIDALIYSAITLDTGRIQADQMSPHMEYQLSVPAHALVRIVRHPWGSITDDARDRLRDVLRKVVGEYCRFTPAKKYGEVAQAAEFIFRGIPQFSYTRVQGQIDCHGVFHPLTKSDAVQVMCISHASIRKYATSIGVVLSRQFLRQRQASVAARCNPPEQCRKTHFAATAVLDRPPPTLGVYFGDAMTQRDQETYKPFEIFTLRYRDLAGQHHEVAYAPVGCILLHADHFTCMWRNRQKKDIYQQYDGNLTVHIRDKTAKSWRAAVGEKKLVNMVFYRQTDETPAEPLGSFDF